MAGELILPEVAAPSNPASGKGLIYATTAVPSRLVHIEDTPGSHTLITADSTDTGASRLKNKDLEDATTNIVDEADTSKKLAFSTGGATTATVLTIAEAQGTSQTLNVPNITASSILITDTLAQNITGVKTMTNMTTLAGTNAVAAMTITPGGTVLSSAAAGAVETDAAAKYYTLDTTNGRRYDDSWNFFKLTGNGVAFTSITDFFGSTSAIPTVLNGVYEIEWHCYFAIAVLSTQVVTWTIVNTQTVTNMVAGWAAMTALANGATQGALTGAAVVTQTAASTALPATGVITIGNHYHVIKALIEAGTAGNVRLRAATASTATIGALRGSFFKVRRLPAGNAGTFAA